MRVVPMLRVEVDGKVVQRPGVPEVVMDGEDGKAGMVRMRPQLLPGETLIDRDGAIPAIIGAHPRHEHDVARHQMVRSVLGTHPAMLAKEADPMALNYICHSLVDAAEAKRLLCANGAGWPAQTLTEMVRMLLEVPK